MTDTAPQDAGENAKVAKGAKKPKKPKLTKEQKRALKLKAAKDLQIRMIRERMLREIALTNKSLKRGKPVWEGIRQVIKAAELRDEMDQWNEKATRILAKKDEKVTMLLKHMEETEKLNERSFSSHLQKVEYLSRSHTTLLQAATILNQEETLSIVHDFLLEVDRGQEMKERVKTNTENIMHAANVVSKDRLKRNYEKYMDVKFQKVTDEVECRYKMRDRTVEKMRKLHRQLLLFIKVLQGDILDVNKSVKYQRFMERQYAYVQETIKLGEIERGVRKHITDLQNELLNIETDYNKRMQDLKLQQAYFFEVRSIIANAIEKNKSDTYKRLRQDSSNSYRVLKKLREYVKQGELLVTLSACCQKYMTQKEKVVRAEDNFNAAEALKGLPCNLTKMMDLTEEELADQMEMMKHFWRRISNARYHNLRLNEEKKKLIETNNKYITIIKSLKKSDDVEYILEAMEIKPLALYMKGGE